MMLGHSVFRQPDVRSFKKYVLKVIFSSLVHSYDVTLFVIAKMGINLETTIFGPSKIFFTFLSHFNQFNCQIFNVVPESYEM